MSKAATQKALAVPAGYVDVRTGIVELLNAARQTAARNVNSLITASHCEIGRRIVQAEQKGKRRAGYGEQLIARLSLDLMEQFARGFSARNLEQMRQFYLTWAIPQTVSVESPKQLTTTVTKKSQTASASLGWSEMANAFALPWSAYVHLLSVKDPYVLKFLNLKDEYSESQLEEALIHRLEDFLLELGSDFTFVGRQRRLRIHQTWYRVDLLFFHRRLRCLVIVDLKLGSLNHADVGQMHTYCKFAKEHWTLPDENPPVGLILCPDKGHALARYALDGLDGLDGLPNKIMAANYKTVLPDAEVLQRELEKTRLMLESRGVTRRR